MKTLALGCFVLVLVLAHGPALADAPPSRDQCFDAHEKSQVDKKDGKLRAMLDDLKICANAACPKLVRSECATNLAEVEKSIPSVRLSAKRADGSNADGAQVAIDGGAPGPISNDVVLLDPGEHVFRFEVDGKSVEKRVSLSAGQRDVAVVGEIANDEKPPPEPQPPPVEQPASKPGISPLVYVLGGVAVVGLAGFVGFGLAGKSAESDLDDCKPNCKADDVDGMRTKYLLADISLGVAVVAAGAGVYLYLQKPKKAEGAAWVRAAPNRSGAGFVFGKSF